MSDKITAYKAFCADWTCNGHQYAVGETYVHDGPVSLCKSGFHACEIPFDCWSYYPHSTTLARVELGGVSDERGGDSKRVAASITITASLSLREWVAEQARVVIALCKTAATGDYSPAAATEHYSHAAATGHYSHAAATGYGGHAAATGYGGHAAATGHYSHAAATGDGGHAVATGDYGHAAATGHNGHAAVCGKNAIAASLGVYGTARAEEGGAIMLAAYDEDGNLVAVRAARVGEDGVEAGKTYRLTPNGEFQELP